MTTGSSGPSDVDGSNGVASATAALARTRARRGLGRVYQPKYKDRVTGTWKTSATWWVQFNHRGKTYREPARSTKHQAAVTLLKRRLAEIGRGRLIGPNEERVMFAHLVAGYLASYSLRGLRSESTAKLRVQHLTVFFEHDRALDITPDRIRAYQLARRQQPAAAATVNRETSALARMLALAVKDGRLTSKPPFPERLEENAPRQGFFEHAEYLAIRAEMPADYRDVRDFGYHSGWRRSEITGLTWPEVDLAGGVIRLAPERSKTKAGRLLPLSPPLREILSRRLAARRLDTVLVFHHGGGQAVGDWRKTWASACVTAGFFRVEPVRNADGTPRVTTDGTPVVVKKPTKLFHDLRRTTARNLIRSGAPERVAMTLTGHKTRSVFDRYNIVSETDLQQATARLAEYVAAQPTTPTVVPLTKVAEGAGR